MLEELRPDLCVIGAGAGGLALVTAAAALAVPVVLIEKGEMGGAAPKDGAIPALSLAAAARTAHAMRTAEEFGIHATEPLIDLARVRAAWSDIAAAVARNQSQARLEAMNIRVIRAAARFKAKDTVEAGNYAIHARRTVLATGASPVAASIPGLEQVRYLTTEGLFDLAKMPTRLIVIGATPAGIEIAQAIRRLGGDVVVLDGAGALAEIDGEFAEIVLAQLEREGVVVREHVVIRRIETRGAGVRVVLAGGLVEETVDGSHIMVTMGRTPNVEGLGLEAAGIAFSKDGIGVGPDLRTSNARVYAIGDATGGSQSAAAAVYHAGLVLRSALFRQSVEFRPELVPRVLYTDPEVATTGLSEAHSTRQRPLHVLRSAFAENDRARTQHRAEGHIRVVTGANGTILGAGIVGPHAGELIGSWQVAISKSMKIGEIADIVFPFPTLSEASRRVAVGSLAETVRNPWLKRGIRWLRKLG